MASLHIEAKQNGCNVQINEHCSHFSVLLIILGERLPQLVVSEWADIMGLFQGSSF